MINEPQYSVKETRDPQTYMTWLTWEEAGCEDPQRVWLPGVLSPVECTVKFSETTLEKAWSDYSVHRQQLGWTFCSQHTSLMPSPRLPHQWWCVRKQSEEWLYSLTSPEHAPATITVFFPPASWEASTLSVHRTNLSTWTSICVKALVLYRVSTFVTSGKASTPPPSLRKSYWCRNTGRDLLVFLI